MVLSWLRTPTESVSEVVHRVSGWYCRLAQIVFMLRPMFCVCLAPVICFRRLADQLTPFIQSVAQVKKKKPFFPFSHPLSRPTDSLCTTLITLESTGLCPFAKTFKAFLSNSLISRTCGNLGFMWKTDSNPPTIRPKSYRWTALTLQSGEVQSSIWSRIIPLQICSS